MTETAQQNGHAKVDLETGELSYCPRCHGLQVGDLERAEKEIRRLRRLNDRLEARLAERDETARVTHKDRKKIMACIDRWKERTGHPKSRASNDRFDVIVARLKDGYSFAEIELAIDGLAAKPYVTKAGRQPEGAPAQRHDALSIALRSGENLERFANLGAQARTNGGSL